RRVAHRDVKPSNVLCQGTHTKLCDFGLSKRADATATYATHTAGVGTPAFMSPELITGGAHALPDSFAAPADVFAFAMLLHCTWTCRLPFEAYDDDDDQAAAVRSDDDDDDDGGKPRARPPLGAFALMSKIAAGQRPALPDDMPPRLKALIAACWAQQPNQRPTMAHVVDDLLAAYKEEKQHHSPFISRII
ncbi:MAG: protein kinase, partial [Cyanobacteria bacterium P01_A01_bin.37]